MASVPVLRDDEAEVIVPETTIIIEYLDRIEADGPPMIPVDADEALEARGWDRFVDQYVSTLVQTIVFDALKPEERRDPETVADARRTLDTAYDLLEGLLAERELVAGLVASSPNAGRRRATPPRPGNSTTAPPRRPPRPRRRRAGDGGALTAHRRRSEDPATANAMDERRPTASRYSKRTARRPARPRRSPRRTRGGRGRGRRRGGRRERGTPRAMSARALRGEAAQVGGRREMVDDEVVAQRVERVEAVAEEPADVVLVAPEHRRRSGRRRDVRGDHAEQARRPALRRPVDRARSRRPDGTRAAAPPPPPPGRARTSRRPTRSRRRTPRRRTAAPRHRPRPHSTDRPRSAARRRAVSMSAGVRSLATTLAPARSAAKRDVPGPGRHVEHVHARADPAGGDERGPERLEKRWRAIRSSLRAPRPRAPSTVRLPWPVLRRRRHRRLLPSRPP